MRPFTQRLSPTIRNLVVAESVVFGLLIMAKPLREPAVLHLALGPGVWAGELWQPLTSLFVHFELWSFFFNMLGLWFVGATIEHVLGRRRFFLLFFGTGLAANLAVAGLMALLGRPSANPGCGDSVLALFVALGVVYGRTPVRVFGQLVLQARILTWILIGMAILSLLFQAAWPLLGGTLVAIVLGYFMAGGRTGLFAEFIAGLRGRRRGGFDVLDGGRGRGGRGFMN
ncbi:MAG: rhomboid family intramembrane serine protease [Deltaproteobacteria bacterium]|jgi:membrane associated rhomboid family serine protease|nr:rhomboid family intramembrane serine protease [Deltaproteobacteria bacterium]